MYCELIPITFAVSRVDCLFNRRTFAAIVAR